MQFNDYQKQAVANKVYGYGQPVVYPALGLAEESGEVLGNVKKMLRDDGGQITPSRHTRLVSELGDVLWYISAIAHDMGVSLDDIASKNIEKISDRRSRNVVHGEGDTR
jgi:NTP pyrophosphatase (non-canonical NTP hydrolase)